MCIRDRNTVKKIGSMSFYHCEKLSSVALPNTLTEIGYSAFNGTKALTTITIPKTVIKAGSDVFEDSGLKTAIKMCIRDSISHQPCPQGKRRLRGGLNMGQKVNPHGLRVGVIKDWDLSLIHI